jgi:two-component system phosphate regulon sensor histidine kinase PhoR
VDDPTTVLVVDDEEGMREGMRRVLERRGFSVNTAADGGSALALLAEKDFDLALVDLKMPGIDGFRVTEAVNESGRETVVVIVSALATVEAAVEVTRHGAFDFLVKPFAPSDLLQVVERAVKQRRLIGDRRMYLSELNRERTLSRQLINSLHDGVIVLNVNTKPVLMNTRAEFLLDIRYREDMPSRSWASMSRSSPLSARCSRRRRTARISGRSDSRTGTPCCGSFSRRGGAPGSPAA